MKQPIHIIYISGFGRSYDSLRKRALSLWRFRDVSVELVSMRWEGQETFEQKLARVEQAIDKAAGKQIVIVGESAGGGMAVHVYARRSGDIHKVMALCGKVSHPETVGQGYYDRSPAFKTAMHKLDDATNTLTSTQKQQFVSLHPLYDPVVPVRETLLHDCRQVRLWSVGHQLSIFLGLTVFAPIIVREARR